jgi:invasion protein IalB
VHDAPADPATKYQSSGFQLDRRVGQQQAGNNDYANANRVAIPPGVELRIGKSPARKVPFASCDNGRCIATMIMDANLLREMAATPTAEAVIQGSQGNTVQFNIQMKGFDKAYAVLSRS